jgi:hypothetical protein
MFASILVMAVSPLLAPASLSPEWNHDYGRALKDATAAGKPIAIFIGSGKDGWQAVGKGTLSSDAVKLLKERYVCLYVDTSTVDGKELAGAFDAGEQPTLVISDKSARYQAFKQHGPLPEEKLEQALNQYTAYEIPQSQIQRTSYYSGPQGTVSTYPGGFSGGFSRGCST